MGVVVVEGGDFVVADGGDGSRPSQERGGALVSIAIALFLVLASSVVFVYFFFGVTVPPNYIGIRQNNFSVPVVLHAGYEEEGLSPGRHWAIPGVSHVKLLPRDFQFVNLNTTTAVPHGVAEESDYEAPELDVPTTDGANVKMDVSLVVRIYDEPGEGHGGPINLIRTYTETPSEQLKRFYQIASGELKKSLRTLSTSEYYLPDKRENAAIAATAAVNHELAPSGIGLWATLIRRFVYADRRIDDQIFAKTLQGQTELLNGALSKLAEAKASTEKQIANWDAQIGSLEVKGETDARVTASQGALYEAQKKAQGDLLVASARAEVDAAKASALNDVAGSDVYIAREMTPLLRTLSGGVVSNIDPFDVQKWADRFVTAPAAKSRQGE